MKTTIVTKFSVGDVVGSKNDRAFGKITEIRITVENPVGNPIIRYILTDENSHDESELSLFLPAEVPDNE